ncbi:hypothetical protein H0H87_012838 [Tephrocybe sp. NHM501043]|nr:hypothetical protein H0H87_012838 [Tephrocybe sp. NHM501043]
MEGAILDIGGYSDIYKIMLHKEAMCLKVLRTNREQANHMAKVFAKEGILWGQLSHENLLPFYGLYFPTPHQNSFVSPWAENGNIAQYLKNTLPRPDGVLLAHDLTAGIAYLHSRGMIHGDLKAANILIDHSGRAYITDFGLSNIDDSLIVRWASQSSAASKGGTPRYQAPELHKPESDDEDEAAGDGHLSHSHNTHKSDVYALGCVFYEDQYLSSKYPARIP